MLHIVTVVVARRIRQENATVPQILRLVAEPPSSLLNGVGVADTTASRHVCHSKTFDGIPAIKRLAADENVGVVTLPVDMWSPPNTPTRSRIHFSHNCLAYSPM